jgi:hypothetical protein
LRAGETGVTNGIQRGKNALLIRDAQPEELDEVSLLIRDAYIEYRHAIPSRHWRFYLDSIMDVRSRLGVSELIVAELDKKLAGTVTLYLEASPSLQEDWPEGWAGVRIPPGVSRPGHRACLDGGVYSQVPEEEYQDNRPAHGPRYGHRPQDV